MDYSPWGWKESETTEHSAQHKVHCNAFLRLTTHVLQTNYAFFFPYRVRKYIGRCQGPGSGSVEKRDGKLVFNGDILSVQEGEKLGRCMMVRVAEQC